MTVQAIAADANSTAANQHGQLTPEQQRLTAAAVRAQATPGLLGGACFAFLFGVILWAVSQSYSSSGHLRDQLLYGGLFAATLVILGALLWRRSQKLGEVRAGRLQRANGHIVWQAGAYRADMPGHTLNLSAFNLGAGTYTFSVLPRSGRVIAAELVALDSPAQAQDELRHALAVANHFNVDDLAAYRAGRLGRSRARRLWRSWAPAAWMLLFALVALVLFGLLVSGDSSKELAPILFVGAVLLGIGGLATALGALSPTLDVLGGKVTTAEGVVQKTMRVTYGRGASTYYYYKLGDQVWTVTAEAYRALFQEPAYRVYFLPRSKMLLGIEPV